MQLIQTVTVSTAATFIEILNLPQSFTDLYVVVSLRSSFNAAQSSAFIGLTSGSGATNDHTWRRLVGTGTAVQSSTATGVSGVWLTSPPALTSTANTWSNAQAYIPNYTSSQNKSVSCESAVENNTPGAFLQITAGLRANTAAVTGIFILDGSGNIEVGSTIYVYGITKGSDGITTAS
jgi:hypothetical protein